MVYHPQQCLRSRVYIIKWKSEFWCVWNIAGHFTTRKWKSISFSVTRFVFLPNSVSVIGRYSVIISLEYFTKLIDVQFHSYASINFGRLNLFMVQFKMYYMEKCVSYLFRVMVYLITAWYFESLSLLFYHKCWFYFSIL